MAKHVLLNSKSKIVGEFIMLIRALHGFLGQPKDFDVLNLNNLEKVALFHTQIRELLEWAACFNRQHSKPCVIMGYSMGGRLALHCLLNNPQKFKAAIILAADPGLKLGKERYERYAADLIWAKRFRIDAWDTLMNDWHSQPALQTSPMIIRKESDFERHSLAQALRCFSLGLQEYLIPFINELDLPILWLAPLEESHKVLELKFKNPRSRLVHMPRGGHRFMMTKPAATSELIQSFLSTLE